MSKLIAIPINLLKCPFMLIKICHNLTHQHETHAKIVKRVFLSFRILESSIVEFDDSSDKGF